MTVVTASENVNSNPLAPFLLQHSITDPLVALFTLKLPHERVRVEMDAAIVLLQLLMWQVRGGGVRVRKGGVNEGERGAGGGMGHKGVREKGYVAFSH